MLASPGQVSLSPPPPDCSPRSTVPWEPLAEQLWGAQTALSLSLSLCRGSASAGRGAGAPVVLFLFPVAPGRRLWGERSAGLLTGCELGFLSVVVQRPFNFLLLFVK